MTTICAACGVEVSLNNFCGNCSEPLTTADTGHHLNQNLTGNNNQGIQVGGDNSGTIIINPGEPEEEKTLIHRSFIKPLTVADRQVKTWWFFAAGALSLSGNIASIIGTWITLTSTGTIPTPTHSSTTSWMPLFMIIGILLLMTGILLHRFKYITIPLINKTIEVDKQGHLFITKITGTCGRCQSPVKVQTVGGKENRQTAVVCTNNPDQHIWQFDRTVLPDAGEDYKNNL